MKKLIPKGEEGWLSRITRYLTDSGNALKQALEKLSSISNDLGHSIRLRLYNNVDPHSYDRPISRIWNALILNKQESGRNLTKDFVSDEEVKNALVDRFSNKNGDDRLKNAMWAKYLNLSNEDVGFDISHYIQESPYKPTINGENKQYYRINPKFGSPSEPKKLSVENIVTDTPLATYKTVTNPLYTLFKKDKNSNNFFRKFPTYFLKEPSENVTYEELHKTTSENLGKGKSAISTGYGMGKYTVSKAKDGSYTSYYDNWNINPFKGTWSNSNIPIISNIEDLGSLIGAKSFELYDRKYKPQN